MCGLFGYSTKKGVELTYAQKVARHRMLRKLGRSMMNRGTDSAGIGFEYGGKILTYKKAERFELFMKSEWFEEYAHDSRFVIGHTRAATHGEVSTNNAHPFIKGHVVGAHNGIVSNYEEINPTVQVDSEVIFELLEKTTPEEAFKDLRGSMAVTWVDARKPDLHLIAHTSPLHILQAKDLETIFWASTPFSLTQAASDVLGKTWQTEEVEEDTLYLISPENVILQKPDIKFKSVLYFDKWAGRSKKKTPRPMDEETQLLLKAVLYEAYQFGCLTCGRIPEGAGVHGFYYDKENQVIYCSGCGIKELNRLDFKWITLNEFTELSHEVIEFYINSKPDGDIPPLGAEMD